MSKNLNKVTGAGLLIALGIIYGDIGTSPLYVFNAIIYNKLISDTLIIGSLSCIIWTITLQTTVKYVILVLRADNKGEGGTFALYALVRRRYKWLVYPAMIGGAALLADGIITPPISITSAIEGLREMPYLANIQDIRIFLRPQWPRSLYNASAPVVHKNTAPNSQKPEGYSDKKSMA